MYIVLFFKRAKIKSLICLNIGIIGIIIWFLSKWLGKFS